jgi:hypothetical protein
MANHVSKFQTSITERSPCSKQFQRKSVFVCKWELGVACHTKCKIRLDTAFTGKPLATHDS